MRFIVVFLLGVLAMPIAATGAGTADSSGLSEIAQDPNTQAQKGNKETQLRKKEVQKRKKAALTAAAIARVESTDGQKNFDRYSERGPKLSEIPVPMLSKSQAPPPAPPIVELGEKFLHPGPISPGFTIPTGAVWQPALWIYGDYWATAGYFDGGVDPKYAYLTNRLDLTFNLRLTGTERFVVSVSPLSLNNDNTGVVYRSGLGTDFVNGISPNVEALFFEGEFDELFPKLDSKGHNDHDFGFAVGRIPALFEGGIMINVPVDGFSVTRDTIMIPNVTPDTRVSALFGRVTRRNDRVIDNNTYMAGLFSETDLFVSTVDVDAAYVESDGVNGGDTFNFGASAIQQLGPVGTTFRINTSTALQNQGPDAGSGVLLSAETVVTLPSSEDILYANTFGAFGSYTSVGRDQFVGGSLSPLGILFRSPIAFMSVAPLSPVANDAVGGAIGYQHFMDDTKAQLVFELAGRTDTNNSNQGMIGFGVQYLRALDSRTSIQLNGFVTDGENRRVGYGGAALWRLRL